MERKGSKRSWVVVVEGAGLLPPGVYSRKKVSAFLGRPGVRFRSYESERSAREAFAALKAQGVVAGGPAPEGTFELLAISDGSYKDGRGSASAVLIDPRLEGRGREVAVGQVAFSWGDGSGDAELRGLLLVLAMSPKGARVRLETDYLVLVEAWNIGKHLEILPLVEAMKGVARAMGVELQVEKAPRREVERAHQEAGAAREGLAEKERLALGVRRILMRIPVRYRKAALDLLERYPGGEALEVWLARRESETRKLLLDLIKNLHPREREALLLAVRTMPEALRKGLKGADREEAWAEAPPTEKQLRYLRVLGYQGPEPQSLLEAHRLIRDLEGRKGEAPPGGPAPGG